MIYSYAFPKDKRERASMLLPFEGLSKTKVAASQGSNKQEAEQTASKAPSNYD